jgi:hypothetical protein
MSPDLDPAVEAAARALVLDKLGFLAPSVNDAFRAECRRVAGLAVAAAAPLIRAQAAKEIALIRAQERAAVRAELLAIAAEYAAGGFDYCSIAGAAMVDAADRIAPEHVTPREKP